MASDGPWLGAWTTLTPSDVKLALWNYLKDVVEHPVPKASDDLDVRYRADGSVFLSFAEQYVRTGRPRLEEAGKTNEALQPWVKAGMSRATWYRRQREKVDGQHR